MGQLLIRLDDELERQLRRLVSERYGNRKGTLSLVVSEGLRQVLNPAAVITTATLLEAIDYVGEASRRGRPRDEILENVFIMLDREFEQSIVRGYEEWKRGKTVWVPRGKDAVRYLSAMSESSK